LTAHKSAAEHRLRINVLDIIKQNKLADVSFTVIKDEILKFSPLQIQEKVENARSWQEVRLIIRRNRSVILKNISTVEN
jgi:hypothetical protein